MKKQPTPDDNTPVTKQILKEELKKYATKKELKETLKETLKDYPTRVEMQLAIDQLRYEIDEKAKQYRDEILTKLDQIVGELAQAREDRLFINHDIQNLKQTDANKLLLIKN